ncbi:MAG: zinc ribbon domain-containing protein [Phycisphaerae bacterium]
MPIYEYRCEACGRTFEQLVRSARAERDVRCSHCGADRPVRQMSVIASPRSAESRPAAPGCGQCCRADGTCPYN